MDLNAIIQNPIITGLIGIGFPLVAGILYGVFVLLRKKFRLRKQLYNLGYSVGLQLRKVSARLNGKSLVDYRAYCKTLANYVDMGIENAIDGKPRRKDIEEV